MHKAFAKNINNDLIVKNCKNPDKICEGCKVNLTELERKNKATGNTTTCDCPSYD